MLFGERDETANTASRAFWKRRLSLPLERATKFLLADFSGVGFFIDSIGERRAWGSPSQEETATRQF